MFAKTIIDSDAFLDLPLTAQGLYFHLGMRADDEGFINNPKKIQRIVGASDEDLQELIDKNFIIQFDSGIVVIKHWKINNYIRNDRKKETLYSDEMEMLTCKNNRSYTIKQSNVRQLSVKCPSIVRQMSDRCQANVSIDKNSIDKNSIDKNIYDQIDSEFESLWKLYPRKQGKEKAKFYYKKAKKEGITFEEVKQGIESYVDYIRREKIESQYIKQGSTFFSQKAWKDDWGTSKGQSQTYDFNALTKMIEES